METQQHGSGDDPMALFKKEAPDVAGAFDGLIGSLVAFKGLDAKTKQLVYIALKAAEGDSTAVKFHAAMAKQLGAGREEVIDAVLLTLTVSGIKGIATCFHVATAPFD